MVNKDKLWAQINTTSVRINWAHLINYTLIQQRGIIITCIVFLRIQVLSFPRVYDRMDLQTMHWDCKTSDKSRQYWHLMIEH